MQRRKKSGFTIAEVLVSVLVLTISITGVLAALAYDAFSSEQSGSYTFALNYSRKVLDLMQSGQIDPMASGFVSSGTPANIESTPEINGTTWRALDQAGTPLSDGGGMVAFWGASGSKERARFDIEKLKYSVNIVRNRQKASVTNNGYADNFKNLLVEIVVTTRWRIRRGHRSVQLRGYYVTSSGTN